MDTLREIPKQLLNRKYMHYALVVDKLVLKTLKSNVCFLKDAVCTEDSVCWVKRIFRKFLLYLFLGTEKLITFYFKTINLIDVKLFIIAIYINHFPIKQN